jgi:Rps23 Pro-64 3,4-dihydroxylase Tpa1-like proline 4-hydroxylase
MLAVDNIHNAKLINSPFKYSKIDNILSPAQAVDLLNNLPTEGNYRSARSEGSDKVYNVVNNILVELGKVTPHNDYLDDSWNNFIQEVQGPTYRHALSALLNEDLLDCYMEVTLKRYKHQDYISAHTDKDAVRATHMIFLNADWDLQWGGLLHFLHDNQETLETFLPTIAQSVAFVRSPVSWHKVCPIVPADKERVAVQVAFWNRIDRTVAAGRKIEKL